MTLEEITQHAADGGRFTLSDWAGGIAWRFLGPEMIDDEDTIWTGYQVATGRGRFMMVGDDREYREDPDYASAIGEDDYCHECGQIGCTHDGR